MSGRFVRSSKYRHVFGDAAKNENAFTSLRANPTGDGDLLAGNNQFFAVPAKGGGGPVFVHRLDAAGRMPVSAPVVNVHKGKVLDMAFSPFVPNMLATASDDCFTKISLVPHEGLTESIFKAEATLEGHQKKVSFTRFHPVANNILATSSYDMMVKIWDLEKQEEVFSIPMGANHIAWNRNGSLLAGHAKDEKAIVVQDARKKDGAIKMACMNSAKPVRCVWMDNMGYLAAVGHERSNRQIRLFDIRNPDKEVTVLDIDQSAGAMMPFYDEDTSVLFLGGKGDGNIRYFEITNEAPHIFFLSEFRNSESTKGMTFLPKTAVDTTKCEIAKCLRLLKESVVPISFLVPRKSDIFQEDLYPDTYAGVPALDAEAWCEGKDAEPATRSMKPGAKVETAKIEFTAKKSRAELEAELEVANKRIAELEAELAKLKAS